MSENHGNVEGGSREGSSKPSPMASDPTKPLSRVDKLAAGMASLSYALRAVGFYLDEGPLRTQTLKASAEALSWARSVQGSGRRHRPGRDEARAVAIQTRDGDQDDTWRTDDDTP